jgi:hypothetical protein|tara:strand:- start:241 stop:495 length:255 start_codon:yes stop_codon:yes gene_type:complete
MIDQLKFIETLKEIKSLLGAGANIGAMNKIDKTITEYQVEVEEFEKWAEAEAQKDAYLEGTVVSDTSDSPFLVHPGSFPGEKNK